MGPKYHLSVITGEKHFQNDKKHMNGFLRSIMIHWYHFHAGHQTHLNLILLHVNGIKVSECTIVIHSYVFFITLAVFLIHYYWEMVFWTLFGAQNRDFRILDAYRFDIIACQWYQCILIDHRNPFICGFITLVVSVNGYYWEKVFWTLFGPKTGILRYQIHNDLILLHATGTKLS